MLFNSWTFVPFILTVLGLYYVLPHRWQNILLLGASYLFYGAWDWRFLLILIFSTTVDWAVTNALEKADDDERKRKILILASVIVNLSLLGFFKYFNFFADSFVGLMGALGIKTSHYVVQVALPIGISFYTFQSLSYAIDVYRRKQDAIKSFFHVAAFVSFFPQLVAGPIQRAKFLAPQIINPRTVSRQQLVEGGWLILWGLTKKVVIADNVATVADRAFASSDPGSGSLAWLGVIAFTIQIYGDFSGYTDTARGLAKLLGIELPKNFQLPYIATNPADFWHRWHISLSTWLRDYLYVTLGGNRKGLHRTYINLALTMLLGGLWHGAAWTYIVWGAYHGFLLVVHRWWTQDSPFAKRHWVGVENPKPLPNWTHAASIITMFFFTMFGWLLFRASSMEQVGNFVRQMFTNFTWTEASASSLFAVLFSAIFLLVMELWIRNEDNPNNRPGWQTFGPVAVGLLIAGVILLAPPMGRSFIYFQF